MGLLPEISDGSVLVERPTILHSVRRCYSPRPGYVDNAFVVEHIEGYTPFEVGIAELVKPGQTFRLTVAVNNELTWYTIPPGRIETLVNGDRKQHYQHDFFNYVGLARSVWLYSVPKTFINAIAINTHVDGTTGTIGFDIGSNDPLDELQLRISVFDEEGELVNQTSSQKGSLDSFCAPLKTRRSISVPTSSRNFIAGSCGRCCRHLRATCRSTDCQS
jgi:hypothetical protein